MFSYKQGTEEQPLTLKTAELRKTRLDHKFYLAT